MESLLRESMKPEEWERWRSRAYRPPVSLDADTPPPGWDDDAEMAQFTSAMSRTS